MGSRDNDPPAGESRDGGLRGDHGYTDAVARFEELDTCAALTLVHAREASASRESMRAFFNWAEHVARPDEGAPKILLALGRLAEEMWVDGTLYVDITGDDSVTKVSVFADYGFGIRERLLPLARLPVPFDEFVRAVRLAPKLIAPFRHEHVGGSLVLTPPDASLDDALFQSIALDESSMLDGSPTAPPPAVTIAPPEAGAVTKPPPSIPEQSGIHTHPTVRRMVAVRPEALRSGNDD